MLELREWFARLPADERPWLIAGKGPSFARRDELDVASYRVLTLNHAVDEIDEVEVAHVADLDVLETCGDRIEDVARWLLMPRRPHDGLARGHALEDLFGRFPVLARLDSQDRLVWYNLHTAPPVGDSPVIGCRWFSSEVVLEILGLAGERTVRTVGIDGGSRYAEQFAHLDDTRLNNSAPSFDVQFFELDRIAAHHGIDLEPALRPLQVFVGCDPSQQVAYRVLAHSILTHCGQTVDIHNLADHPTRVPGDPANRGHTEFSFARFAIPELCGYEGSALYLDADMLVFADISELWTVPFGRHKVQCTVQEEPPPQWRDHTGFHPGKQLSVMMLDCGRLDWKVDAVIDALDTGEFTYAQLMNELCLLDEDEIGGELPAAWNHLEHYEPGSTLNVHFTVVNDQPWKNDRNPLAPLWERAYEHAVAAGAVPPAEVAEGIEAGHLKPSLADALTRLPSNTADRGGEASRAHIAALQAETSRQRQSIERLERMLEAQRRSATWRAGRALLGPIDLVRRLLGKDPPRS